MAIDGGNIIPDATTYVAPTGGFATLLNVAFAEGRKAVARVATETGFLDRHTFEFSSKDPVANASAPGGWTQSRSVLLIKQPYTLANGNRTVNTLRIELAVDPEVTAAESLALRLAAAECLGRPSYVDFWDTHDMT